jgi:hypothetical protein
MQPLPPTLIRHLLLPYRHIAAIVPGLWIVGGQRSAVSCEGRMFRRAIGLECGSGALGGHVLVSAVC